MKEQFLMKNEKSDEIEPKTEQELKSEREVGVDEIIDDFQMFIFPPPPVASKPSPGTPKMFVQGVTKIQKKKCSQIFRPYTYQ